MSRASLVALLVGLPTLAYAQQVPALQASATASASATAGAAAPAADVAAVANANAAASAAAGTAGVPAGNPPLIHLVAPSAPLNAKEKHAVALAGRWVNRAVMPHAGEDGFVRFLFGATLPTVVCAPLQVCDLALQPGEVVNAINLGDKVRWNVSPALSGSPAGPVTHLIIKPYDAGLQSSMTIATDRRTYAVKLVSTQTRWMPLVAFNYPEDPQAQWNQYRQTVGLASASASMTTSGGNAGNLQFLCIRSSDRPSWTPLHAYTDGLKTYIEFSRALSATAAPALVALANDGGWFSRPTSQVVNYRPVGNRYVVDAALNRAALISGVGGAEERVTLTREDGCR